MTNSKTKIQKQATYLMTPNEQSHMIHRTVSNSLVSGLNQTSSVSESFRAIYNFTNDSTESWVIWCLIENIYLLFATMKLFNYAYSQQCFVVI